MNEMNSFDLAFRTKLKILKQKNKLWLSKRNHFDHTCDRKEGQDVTENGIKIATESDSNVTANLGDLLQENIKPVSADTKQSRITSASSEKRNARGYRSTAVDQEMRKNDFPLTGEPTAPAPGITTKQAKDFLITPASACLSERQSDTKNFYQARDKDKLQLNLKLFEKFRYAMNKGEVATETKSQNSIRPKSSPATTKRNCIDDGTKESKPRRSFRAHATDRKYSELRAMSQTLSHNKNGTSSRSYQPSHWNIAELKVGGYSYQTSKNIYRDTREKTNRSGQSEENCQKQESAERKGPKETKAIIVPSHTTLDCPLCGVYYDENHSFHTEYPERERKQNRFQSYPGPNNTSFCGSTAEYKVGKGQIRMFK